MNPSRDRLSIHLRNSLSSSHWILGYTSDRRCQRHNDNCMERSTRHKSLEQVLIELEEPWIQLDNNDSTNPKNIHDLTDIIALVHDREFIQEVIDRCLESSCIRNNNEVYVTPKTLDALVGSITSCLTAIHTLAQYKARAGYQGGFIFCNCRPPSHHSGFNSTHGFCVFNNVLITSYMTLKQYPHLFPRISIFDFDAHGCDGTVDILSQPNAPSSISCFSIHQQDLFPCLPLFNHTKVDGDGIHLRAVPAHCSWARYQQAFLELIHEMKSYQPELIIISCGFDSCALEHLTDLPVQPAHYQWMTHQLMQVCPFIISVLEGGYNLHAIQDCLSFHLQGALNYFQEITTTAIGHAPLIRLNPRNESLVQSSSLSLVREYIDLTID